VYIKCIKHTLEQLKLEKVRRLKLFTLRIREIVKLTFSRRSYEEAYIIYSETDVDKNALLKQIQTFYREKICIK